ncbi:FkbM family methyltransferase [Mesorhizobium sp. M0306]|uniref:FkbM family methyltransferase n=1 Tax=Mesorhizobium sp. M0306 TaxID=2956932 RepID=UPI00333CDAF9
MLSRIVTKLRQEGVGSAVNGARRKLQIWWHSPKIEISSTRLTLKRFGTRYGGWTVFEIASLRGSKIVSCGAGEDVSFDISMASELGCSIVIVDPTPRAVEHVTSVIQRIRQGRPGDEGCGHCGSQSVGNYDLSNIFPSQIVLVERAIWCKREVVRFFAPQDARHVSHSIVNIQHGQRLDQPDGYIDVHAVTLQDILEENDIEQLEMLKLDIEGAEISVIRDIIEKGLRPKQLLVEFDGLLFPSTKTRADIKFTDSILREAGYNCYHRDGVANFLYALRAEIANWERAIDELF